MVSVAPEIVQWVEESRRRADDEASRRTGDVVPLRHRGPGAGESGESGVGTGPGRENVQVPTLDEPVGLVQQVGDYQDVIHDDRAPTVPEPLPEQRRPCRVCAGDIGLVQIDPHVLWMDLLQADR